MKIYGLCLKCGVYARRSYVNCLQFYIYDCIYSNNKTVSASLMCSRLMQKIFFYADLEVKQTRNRKLESFQWRQWCFISPAKETEKQDNLFVTFSTCSVNWSTWGMIAFPALTLLELTGMAAAGGVDLFWMKKWALTASYFTGKGTPHL